MPFEGDVADFTLSPPVVETPEQRTIRKAREMLSSPGRWARTWQSGEAFCILGALRYAHNGDAHTPGTGGAQTYVMRVLRRFGYTGITTFNDKHASHAQVLIVLDAAYHLAGKQKWAKLDVSLPRASRVRAHFGKDLMTREPLPPPFHHSSLRPSVADVIEHVIPAQRAEWEERFPDRVLPRVHAIDAPLLAAARLMLRQVL